MINTYFFMNEFKWSGGWSGCLIFNCQLLVLLQAILLARCGRLVEPGLGTMRGDKGGGQQRKMWLPTPLPNLLVLSRAPRLRSKGAGCGWQCIAAPGVQRSCSLNPMQELMKGKLHWRQVPFEQGRGDVGVCGVGGRDWYLGLYANTWIPYKSIYHSVWDLKSQP